MPASSISRSSRSVSNGARDPSRTCIASSTVRPPLRSAGRPRSRQRASAARPAVQRQVTMRRASPTITAMTRLAALLSCASLPPRLRPRAGFVRAARAEALAPARLAGAGRSPRRHPGAARLRRRGRPHLRGRRPRLVRPRHRRLRPRPARLRRQRRAATTGPAPTRSSATRSRCPAGSAPATRACRSSSSATPWAAASRSPRPPHGLDADALVLAGPAIAGGDALNPLYRTAARLAAAAAPERRWTGEGLIAIRPTDNPAAHRPRRRRPPPLRRPHEPRALRPRPAHGPRRRRRARASSTPTLVLMGAHDEVLRPAPGRARSPSASPAAPASSSTPTAGTGCSATSRPPRVWQDVGDFVLSAAQP